MFTHLLLDPIKAVPAGSAIFPVTFAAEGVIPNRPSEPAVSATELYETVTVAPEFVTVTS